MRKIILCLDLVLKGIRLIKSHGLRHFSMRLWTFIIGRGWQSMSPSINLDVQYQRWLANKRQHRFMNTVNSKNKIGLVICGQGDRPASAETIKSVFSQSCHNWELYLDSTIQISQDGWALKAEQLTDDRIVFLDFKAYNNPIQILERIDSDYVWFVKSGDVLRNHAISAIVQILDISEQPDLIYSDDDKYDIISKKRFGPRFKPGWSAFLLCSFNYIGFTGVLRKELLGSLENPLSPVNSGDTYRLLLQLINQDGLKVERTPDVLYSARTLTGARASSQLREQSWNSHELCGYIEELFKTKNHGIKVNYCPKKEIYNYRLKLINSDKVSIIIPTKDNGEILKRCIDSIRLKSSYNNYEIIIIDNGSSEKFTIDYINELKKLNIITILSYPHEFNYPLVNNMGAAAASGSYLIFLNDDTEVVSSDWIEALLEHCQMPEVGAVGAYLLFPNGLIQHAGIVVGMRGSASHCFYKSDPNQKLYLNLADCVREVSAVTAACLMIRTDYFNKVGGFNPAFRLGLNDVDLCLRLMKMGLSNIYTPHARLIHHESFTRGDYVNGEEIKLFREIYNDFISGGDPYYHPELSLKRNDYSLAV